MPLPRKSLVSLEATPYYHCVSRCVRRAFLCGKDAVTGRCYEHRRAWIEQRLLELSEVFALDLCAYAVMHNHHHVVVHVDRDAALAWCDREVIERWHRLFAGSLYSQRFMAGEALLPSEEQVLEEQIAQWRERLMDISWFMRCLNESIARRANREDECTGRFWEGRFKSQALLDEKALAACLAYVDLNPVRAGVADRPEASEHTAVKQRIERAREAVQPNHPRQQPTGLFPFAGDRRVSTARGLPFRLTDYLELVDWTGRQLRDDKRGAIPGPLPAILTRLRIEPDQWRNLTTRFESRFKYLVGGVQAIRRACRKIDRHWVHGLASSQALLESA